MRIYNNNVFSGSFSTSTNSNTETLEHIYGYSIHAIITTAGTGTIALQASNDNVNFIEIAFSSFPITGSDTVMWNVREAFSKYVRIALVVTTGTITVSCTMHAKGI